MVDQNLPDIDPALQPVSEDLCAGFKEAFRAVHLIRTRAPSDGFTVQSLGEERAGHAVLIDDSGLFVTIGYLIIEAEQVWLVDDKGAATQADVIGTDSETGLGLVQMLGKPEMLPIPIDLLAGVKDDLLLHGNCRTSLRPWLGMFSADASGKVIIAGLWDGGPADDAGLETGDLILEIGGHPVDDMASMYKLIWASGQAGDIVTLTVYRDRRIFDIEIRSADRRDFHKKPGLH